MDLLDRAQQSEEQQRAAALEAQAARAGVRAGDWRKLSSKWCGSGDCGERIPDERRRAIPGVEFCVECQALSEQRQRINR